MTLDELVVKLVLDATGFNKGQTDAVAAAQKGAADVASAATKGEKAQTDAHKRTTDSATRMGSAILASNKKVIDSFEGAIRTGLTFLAVLAGAKGIEDFTRKITELDAAIGRMSQGMGQAPETLSGIGRAAERMGGSFGGAVGGLRNLSDAFQQLRTTGNTAIMEPLARLQALSGKSIKFGKDVHENYLSIADAMQALGRKDPAQADFLGRQILGDEGLVTVAKGGRSGVLAAEAESRRHGVINPEDAAAAQKLQSAYGGLSNSVVDLGTKIETKLSPYVSDLLTKLNNWIDKNKDLVATKVTEWVQQFVTWIQDHQKDITDFGKAVGDIAIAAGTIAAAFSSQSPMVMALEAFAILLGTRLLSPLNLVLAAMRAIGAIPLTGALAAAFGAKYLADNTMSNVDPWADQTAGETAMRAADPGLADRVYGKRGEQLPRGNAPHHGLGVHATPHDTRTLWQKRPKWLGGQDAPTAVSAPAHGVTEAGKQRVQSWMGFFQRSSDEGGMGLSKEKAAAMVGMMQGESGQNLTPNQEGYDVNGPSGGTAQWHDVDGKPGGRLTALKAFAEKSGKPWTDVDVQQQFWKHEAETSHRTAFAAIQAAPDGPSALRAGVHGFEVPRNADGETAKRLPNYSRVMRGDFDQKVPAPIGDVGRMDRASRPTDREHVDAQRSGKAASLDPAHQKLADAMRSGSGNPIKVEMTDASAQKIGRVTVGHASRQFLEAMAHARRLTHHIPDMANKSPRHMALHGNPSAMDYHRSVIGGAREAMQHHTTTNHNSSSETKIGSIAIHTAATDARGMAADIEPIFRRAAEAGRRNYGLA